MTDASDLVSFSTAAEEKDCSRTTLYRAVEDDRLNSVDVDGRQMLVRDDVYEQFEPRWKGGRVSKYSDDDSE